ncbi:MAG: exodeoxyribonuclease VII large subunit [Oscillospiraceae bacterium]
MDNRIFDVSELNNYIKDLIDGDGLLAGIYVRGELSNYKVYPSGHHYFTMKDKDGALRCVMFKGSASKLRFAPENGMKVIAFGRISVFPRDGAYQLYVSEITPDGVGDLYVAFEQLKKKLGAEGLFEERYKKPIPRFPEKIAVITSSAGAAVRDIIRILGKRYPLAKVIVLPVRVQGAEAPPEIAGAIKYANRYKVADVIITGRGGGSIEDLWAFNDERVARAIFASSIPVISAVGHEPDVTISDFVADARASTPSNAAELAVPDMAELLESFASADIRLGHALRRKTEAMRQSLLDLSSKRVLQNPKNYLDDKRLLLDHIQTRFISSADRSVKSARERYIKLASKLDAMSPLKVLGRGYAIAKTENGTVIKSASDVNQGDKIKVRLARDEISCTAD